MTRYLVILNGPRKNLILGILGACVLVASPAAQASSKLAPCTQKQLTAFAKGALKAAQAQLDEKVTPPLKKWKFWPPTTVEAGTIGGRHDYTLSMSSKDWTVSVKVSTDDSCADPKTEIDWDTFDDG